MKQTALEWLYEEFTKTNYLTEDEFYMIFNQAKEMEKEQIINSREDGFLWGMRNTNNFYADKVIESEQYYKQTYESNK